MRIRIPEKFEAPLWNRSRFLILCGGSGGGKSEFAARKIIYRCVLEGDHRFVIIRKYKVTTVDSVISVFEEILQEAGIKYNYNKTLRRITFYNARGEKNILIFTGLDDPEKMKSFKGMTGVWMEELSEFTEKDFKEVNRRLRGKTKHYKQIIGSLNPDESTAKWVKIRFFDNTDPVAYTHHSTVFDNPFLLEEDPEYVKELEKEKDSTLRKIYLEGIWAQPEGLIFPRFQIIQPKDIPATWETLYGLDFGFTNPNALLEIKVGKVEAKPGHIYNIGEKREERKVFYFRELIYQTRQTEGQLIDNMNAVIPDKSCLIVADSEAPDRIESINLAGFNCVGCPKPKNSVVDGIRFLKQVWGDIYSVPSNQNLHKERSGYKWPEDKEGNETDEKKPIAAFGNHLLDGGRYAMSYRFKKEYITGEQVVKYYKRRHNPALNFGRR